MSGDFPLGEEEKPSSLRVAQMASSPNARMLHGGRVGYGGCRVGFSLCDGAKSNVLTSVRFIPSGNLLLNKASLPRVQVQAERSNLLFKTLTTARNCGKI